jgi:prepilin peptidase CpaA
MPSERVMAITPFLPISMLVALFILCALAVVHDLLFRRIPNGLMVAGVVLGILFQAFAPAGEGLFHFPAGSLGLTAGLLGGLTGLGLLMPMYAVRTLGAGDVKLLAMIGVWLGPTGVAWATLWTLLAGGVLAVVAALCAGAMRRVLANLHFMLTTTMLNVQAGQGAALQPPAQTTGRLPYAVAIVTGTAIEAMRQWTAA